MKLFAVEKEIEGGWETMLFVRVEDEDIRDMLHKQPENIRLRPVDHPEPGYDVVRAIFTGANEQRR